MKKILLLIIATVVMYSGLLAHATIYFDTRPLFASPLAPTQDLVAVNFQGAFDYIRVGTLSQSISATDLYVTFSVPTSNSCARLSSFGGGSFPINFFLQPFTDAGLQTPLTGNSVDASFGIRALPDGTCVAKFDKITLPGGSYIILAFGLLPQFVDRLNPWPLTVTAGGTWESVPPFCPGGTGINNCVAYSGTPYVLITDVNPFPAPPPPPPPLSEPSLMQLTNSAGETAMHPNWSPKDDFISYISNRGSGNGRMNDVWVVAPDGSNAHQLTAMPDDGFEGGTFDAFWIGSTGDLVLVDVNIIYEWLRLQLSANPSLPVARTAFDGPSPNYQELLTIPGGLGGLSFAVSRDGQNAAWSTMTSFSCPWITNAVISSFSALNGQATTSIGSFVTSGSLGCTQIPKSEAIVGISFSPDASHLVIARTPDPNFLGYDLEIYTASGQFVRKLTNNGADSASVINWNPSWSSDGRIAFASNQTGRFEIYTINSDGSNLQPITTNGGDWPTWSPDLSKIAFQSSRSGNSEIYSISAIAQNQPAVPPGTLGPPNPALNPQATVAEPVSTGNGNYFYQHTDFLIPGRGLPIVFARTYNARDSYVGPLGANWTHNYNIILKKEEDGSVTIRWGDGHSEFFVLSGGTYISQPGVVSKLTGNPDGTFVLRKKDLTQYNFSPSGQLISIEDRNGNAVTLTYDGAGNLTAVTDPGGRTLILVYDTANHIAQIIDPIGRTVSFAYSASNDLISSMDQAGGLMTFIYDGSHRVVSITQPTGVLLLANTYDSIGRVTFQTNGRGFVTGFAYDTPTPGSTVITDARGNTTMHTYDSALRIVKITASSGDVTSFAYDSNNNRTSVGNQNGNTTTFSYDALGNITAIKDPFGNISTFAYDKQNNLLSASDAKHNATIFGYDDRGNLVSIRDALRHTTAFTYDRLGQLTSKKDASGNTTFYSYDMVGNLSKTTDALGDITTLGYDPIGRLTDMTDANGHTAHANYDALSHLTATTDVLNHRTAFSYDAVGNLLTVTDANGNATSYAYDAVNNLVAVTDALGHVTKYSYDENNNRIAFINAKANITRYTYDALNRLSSATDPLSFVTAYSYDALGSVIAVKDANGNTNRFTYDALNRLITISYGDGAIVKYSYDANGNRTEMSDPHGITAYSYDALNRLTSVANHGGKTVQYQYNAVGSRQSITYPDGKVVTYAYDSVNRLSQVHDWLGRTTTYQYDVAGNLASLAYPNRAGISFAYDDANRLVRVINSFDGPNGEEGEASHHFGVFEYLLDAVGNRIQVSNGHGKIIRYSYDNLYELTDVAPKGSGDEDDDRDDDELTASYSYDPAGNRVKAILRNKVITYSYDPADRLLRAGDAQYAFDVNGNQISVTKTNNSSPITYRYDAANRLVSVTDGRIDSHFSYDGDGNRISQSVAGITFNYVNDMTGALPVVLQQLDQDGDKTFTYGLNLISESGIGFDNFYHYDGLGSVAALTDFQGQLTQRYVYDVWGAMHRSISVSHTRAPNEFLFSGEALDPGTRLYFLRARYYDPTLGRFISRDPLSGSARFPLSRNRFEYALANPLRYKDPTGLFWIEIAKTFVDVANDFSQWYTQFLQPAEQSASDFNQCTLHIEQCSNIGQQETRLDQNIARLGTGSVETGAKIVIKTTLSPMTYGLEIPPALKSLEQFFNLPQDLKMLKATLTELFSVPVAHASNK